MAAPRLESSTQPPAEQAFATARPAAELVVAGLATIGACVAVGLVDDPRPVDLVRAALVASWACSGAVVGGRRQSDRLAPIALLGAGVGASAMLADAVDQSTLARILLAFLAAIGLHLLISLPAGRVDGKGRRTVVIVGYVVAGFVGLVASHDHSGPTAWPIVLLWLGAIVIGWAGSRRRSRSPDSTDRRRMQWVDWSLAVLAESALVVVALRLLVDWPPRPPVVVLAATVLVPGALAAGTNPRMIARVDRLLAATVSLAGLTTLVIAAYATVVVVHGRSLTDDERTLLLLSMAAALAAAMVFLPLRSRLADAANHLVYGTSVAPDDALRTWGTRLTRAIPLEELLLQLTESLRASMSLVAAEIYSGSDGRYELAAGVPHRSAPALILGAKERQVVARAGVSGGTWLDVWIPQLAPGSGAYTRVAPIVHGGTLLGLIVLTRDAASGVVTAEDDRVVTELARQVGLALHNVQLDSALQASMEALQQTNMDLQKSRLRIVSSGDAERRKLERNLHDGAQQHLVAMAVKLRIAEELIEDDPVEAVKVIEELRGNLKDAIAELRALAHGIFPPLLSSGGLREALPAAAGRSSLDATVDTTGIRRYSPEIESTVYFCCLEALQNAGKYAGDDAQVTICLSEVDGRLVFEIADDGAGFDAGGAGAVGHGFVNMADRVGTVDGSLVVVSAPGQGTSIRGEILLP